jgi:hypothetical protein
MSSKSRTVLSLVAFGLVASAAAVGDGPVFPPVIAPDCVDAFLVDDPASHVPGDPWTMCVDLGAGGFVPPVVPCVVAANADPLAVVNLVPGPNYVLVPDVGPDVLAVAIQPGNPGVN